VCPDNFPSIKQQATPNLKTKDFKKEEEGRSTDAIGIFFRINATRLN
jgi:hypothetical protein